MGFQINTNIGALKAYNALSSLNSKTQKAQLRLATQKRINSVADDTSGFNVGKALDQKVKLMQAAQGNVGSAKDMLATAESQLISIKDMITQIKGKQADASNPASNATAIAKDIKSIALEIDSILANTKFNDTALLTSSGGGAGFAFQTGASSGEKLTVDFNKTLGGTSDVATANGGTAEDVGSTVSASLDLLLAVEEGSDEAADKVLIAALTTTLEAFETTVDDSLGSIGNFVQRLDAKDDSLTSAIANSQASVSRLFDADMAMEQLNATKSSIGAQAATSMLAQLNFAPQAVLQLLG